MASIDRLSALPDEIISHILSFLRFRTSLSTRTLSARWRRLWAYAPNIAHPGVSSPYTISDRTEFVRTLTKILSQCEAHGVNRLRLPMGRCNEHELEACLESAFACNVKILDLKLPYELHIMPPFVFTSKNLVDLRIIYLHIEMKKGDVCLPALKRLYLKRADLRLGCSLGSLISGCPVLEDLTLVNCYLNEGENVPCISSPTMKRLVLRGGLTSTSRLKIDTPDLIEALVDVRISNDDLFSRSLVELVGRFSNVKHMKLRARGKVPVLTPVDLNIKLHNLTKLKVKGDWRFISYFVEKANKLEVLNVRQYSEWEMEETLQLPMPNSIMKLHNLTKFKVEVEWWFLIYLLEKADRLEVLTIRKFIHQHNGLAPPFQVPNCLSSHLKIVQIHELKGTEHELDMVRYLLKNAKVLERMELHWYKGMERHCIEESIGRISSFDRGSEKCKIACCSGKILTLPSLIEANIDVRDLKDWNISKDLAVDRSAWRLVINVPEP
ncbi:F-box/RNI-like superfamily protein [Striga asiatica]|uniref:F-box/RNI-like superfamily protein n=1 Tax=Striga asiatica TaxID=4170 RepID=A0A5A7R7T8_STRAF|nr:F-box/RNI-like superfamily protein [Striga asiatica]